MSNVYKPLTATLSPRRGKTMPKVRVVKVYDIDIDTQRESCCGCDHYSYTRGSMIGSWICEVFGATLSVAFPGSETPIRCEKCLSRLPITGRED